MATSHLGDFSQALDHFHDSCDWVWDGGWTEQLEEATMELLAALDTHFEDMKAKLQQSPMGASMLSEIGPSQRRLEASLAKALESHDIQAVGRVYGAVRSLLTSQSLLDMFGPMMGGGAKVPMQDTELYKNVMAFEKARFNAASDAKRTEVKGELSKLIDAADSYVAELASGQATDFIKRWQERLRAVLVDMRDNPEAVIHPMPFQQLRSGEGGGYMADMMKSVMDSFGSQGGPVKRADTIETVSALAPSSSYAEAEAKVTRWSESLVDESVSFGSPMSPFEVHGREPWVRTVMASMTSLMSLGFGYVTTGVDEAETAKIVGLLDRVRATLPLDEEEEFLSDKRRKDRLKDVCRVVRAARKKGQKLSLSANTDFKGTLKALREHHSDNWVGKPLEGVWEAMASEQRVFGFELWLTEGDGQPRLIAADFGHPHSHGKAYYVATRFFDREHRNLQPGFILAFAEAECLRRAGCALWDLGGSDNSPMMQYKPQVAIVMERTDFLRRLREQCRRAAASPAGEAAGAAAQCPQHAMSEPQAAPPISGGQIPTGMIFADIGEDEIWGSVYLRKKEEKAKAAFEAAQKAAKKVQKPSKATKKAAKVEAAKAQGNSPREAPKANKDQGKIVKVPKEAPKEAAKVAEAPSSPEAQEPSVEKLASTESQKALAKQRFMEAFQKLLAEGVAQEDAVAQALQIVKSR